MAYRYTITHKGKASIVSDNKITKYDLWPNIAMLTSAEPFSPGWPFLEVFNLDTQTKIFSVQSSVAYQYSDIAVNDNYGNLWFGVVTETGTSPTYSLFKYNLSGVKLLDVKLGTASTSENCWSIAVDKQANVYAAGDNRMYKYDNNGNMLDFVTRPYNKPPDFSNFPVMMKYRSGYVWVVGRIVNDTYMWKYDTDFNLQWTFFISTSAFPYSFDVDDYGYSYVGYGDTALQVTPNGATGWTSQVSGSQMGVFSTSVDKQNNIYFSRYLNAPLKYFSNGVTQSITGPTESSRFDLDDYSRIVSVESVFGVGANPTLDTIKISSSNGSLISSFTFSSIVTVGLGRRLLTYKFIR